jgi:tetratricopeptide (TPR) repeat protein/transglutaminase-like putative cysteine protease
MSYIRMMAKLTAIVVLLVSAQAAANPYRTLLSRREAQLERLRRTPGGVVALQGLHEELADWVPADEISRVLDRARRPDSHPLVQGFGHLVAAQVAAARGQEKKAARLRRQAGVIKSWFLCGPVPADDASVEQTLGEWPGPRRRFPGRRPARWVSWRPLPVEVREARLPLSSFVGGTAGQDAAVYLQVVLRSRAARPAVLRLGTAGPFKVFLNGREVARGGPSLRSLAPDQDVVGLGLVAGVNRIVIRVEGGRGRWDIHARLTRPDGGRLDGVRAVSKLPPGKPRAVKAAENRKTKPVDPARWLEQRATPRDAEAERDWAHYQVRARHRNLTDSKVEKWLLEWVRRANTAEDYLLVARTRRDPDAERRLVRRALSVAPSYPWALVRLARLLSANQRQLAAARILDGLHRRRPSFLPATLELADSYRTAGLDSLAARLLDLALVRHRPAPGGLILERANLALVQEDGARAERLFRRYLRWNRADSSTRRTLANLALDRADGGAAAAELRTALEHSPHLGFLRMELASVLDGAGQVEQAVAEYRKVTRIDPTHARAWERMGYVLQRGGRSKRAWDAWQQALRLQPQNADLRVYLALLAPKRRHGLAERERVDPTPLIKEARARRRSPAASARFLLEATAIEVHENGLGRTLRQRVVQVHDKSGIRDHASFMIAYNPDRQLVDLRVARVHRADGTVVSRAIRREQEVNEPWAGLWYDLRALEVRFAGLKPGDIVELEYLVEDVARENLLSDYFGDLVHLQREIPVHRFVYSLITPASRKVYVRAPRLPGVRRSARRSGGARVLSFHARDLPPIAQEPGMPGWSEVSDYLHVSTYGSWEAVGRWYWRLIRDQLRPDRRIVETAKRLGGGGSELERIRAVHNYVARNTRYVGLEFGIHSYKPYAAPQVLARKFGDCKDKATLMIALLGQLGIEAEMVLVRTRQRGNVDRSPASLAPFDHALVHVPAHKLYLDATAEFAGSTELPFQDQGVLALHVARGGRTRLVTTPLSRAADNTTRIEERLRVEANGHVRLDEVRTITGQAAPRWRSYYQAADTRRQRYEKAWNGWVNGARVLEVKMRGLDALERPVRVEARVAVTGLARSEGAGRITLPPGSGAETSLVQAYGRLTKRSHPLQLDFPWRAVQRAVLTGPPGWRFADVPPDHELKTPFGRFKRSVKRKGRRQLVVTQEIRLEAARVEPKRYAAFRRFLEKLDRLMAERVALVSGPTT